MNVIGAIPPSRVDWGFPPDKFTLADLVRHIAASNRYIFPEVAKGNRSSYHGCGKEYGASYDEIVAFSGRLHREAIETLSNFTAEDLQRRCTTPDGLPSRCGSGRAPWWSTKSIIAARFTFIFRCSKRRLNRSTDSLSSNSGSAAFGASECSLAVRRRYMAASVHRGQAARLRPQELHSQNRGKTGSQTIDGSALTQPARAATTARFVALLKKEPDSPIIRYASRKPRQLRSLP